MVNDYISRNHFVVWKRTDERVRALQESWGGYMGSHMEFDMAGDAGVVKYAGMAAKLSGPFGDAQTAIAPSSVAIDLKNTINIDKLLKRFEWETTFITLYNSDIYNIYMK